MARKWVIFFRRVFAFLSSSQQRWKAYLTRRLHPTIYIVLGFISVLCCLLASPGFAKTPIVSSNIATNTATHPHPKSLFHLGYRVYTSHFDAGIPASCPPNPPTLGGFRNQSPPGLGDLGGFEGSNSNRSNLCGHRSPSREKGLGDEGTAAEPSIAQTSSTLNAEQFDQSAREKYAAGQFREAAIAFQQAAQQYQVQGNPLRQALSLSNLSLSDQQLGEWTDAEQAISASLTLLETELQQQNTPDRQSAYAQALDIRAKLELSRGQAEQAIATWEGAATIHQQLGNLEQAVENQINQARALQHLGLHQRAITVLENALKTPGQSTLLLTGLQDPSSGTDEELTQELKRRLQTLPISATTVTALQKLGESLQVVGNLEQASTILQYSLKLAEDLALTDAIAPISLSLGNLVRAQAIAALRLSNLTVKQSVAQLQKQLSPIQHELQYRQTKAAQAFAAQTEEALAYYQQAANSSRPDIQVQAHLNRLNLFLDKQQETEAETAIAQVDPLLSQLSPNRMAIDAHINFAQSLRRMADAENWTSSINPATNSATTVNAFRPHPKSLSHEGLPCTNSSLPGRNSCVLPPNPPTLGDFRNQSPPKLGDLGGLKVSNSNRSDLYVHSSPSWEKGLGDEGSSACQINDCQVNSSSSPRAAQQLQAAQLLATAYQQAIALGDPQAESYALGSLGKLYEHTEQWTETAELTQQALEKVNAVSVTNLPYTVNDADLAYRWQYQLGRIRTAQGDRAGAIAAYESAVTTLQDRLRRDVALSNLNYQFSFNEDAQKPVHQALMDLLLRSEHPEQEDLQRVREVSSSLLEAQLTSYLQEPCAVVTPQQVDNIVSETKQRAAIFYPVILRDRLEVIVKLPGIADLYHYRHRIARDELLEQLSSFQIALEEDYTFAAVERISKQFYDWLIQPAEEQLKASEVDTLVFTLDRQLQTIPMAALYDGEHYLVDKYAISEILGLRFANSVEPLQPEKLKVIGAGLSTIPATLSQQIREDFSPLSKVKDEIEALQNSGISVVVPLIDEKFTRTNFNARLNEEKFSVVHLATHGQFSLDPQRTFLLATPDSSNNGLIDVNELGALFRVRGQVRLDSIELLVLNACETASGDDLATLGIAGTAVRAGARSAIASLWTLDDAPSATFTQQLYENLRQPDLTKAEALRQAQIALKQDAQYRHPRYWSPYILAGNWLPLTTSRAAGSASR